MEETRTDRVIATGRAGAAIFGPLVEVYDRVFVPPLTRRRESWFTRLAQRVERLEDEIALLTEEQLQEATTVVIQASLGALETHHEEKRTLFVNAVGNAILEPGDFEMREYFLRLLRDFQVVHVKVLLLIRSPEHAFTEAYSADRSVVDLKVLAARVFSGAGFAVDIALRDLVANGLVDPDKRWYDAATRYELIGAVTSAGRAFLDFLGPEADE